MIKAVFFDLDGTLINSLPDLAAAGNALRADHDLPPLEETTIRSFIGDGVIKLASRCMTGKKDFDLPKSQILQYRQEFIHHYSAHLTDATVMFDGVDTMLKAMKASNKKIALITNKGEQGAKTLLAHFHIAQYFDAIYGGDTFSACKPDPMPLIEAAKALHISPHEALMVGDSVNDILAGKRAGTSTALVDFGYGDVAPLLAEKNTQPDYVISDLSQLLETIN